MRPGEQRCGSMVRGDVPQVGAKEGLFNLQPQSTHRMSRIPLTLLPRFTGPLLLYKQGLAVAELTARWG